MLEAQSAKNSNVYISCAKKMNEVVQYVRPFANLVKRAGALFSIPSYYIKTRHLTGITVNFYVSKKRRARTPRLSEVMTSSQHF